MSLLRVLPTSRLFLAVQWGGDYSTMVFRWVELANTTFPAWKPDDAGLKPLLLSSGLFFEAFFLRFLHSFLRLGKKKTLLFFR